MQAATSIYEASRSFPREEQFALTSQLRRSAVSIPSNIAEGYGRGSKPDYVRFLQIARGSLFEAQTQLELATQLRFHPADSTEIQEILHEIERMLNSMISRLSS
ncbi:MAG: four helix bundle protein [Verrucomicrobium sp.]|nr:four helix bundle protein [Verrucomicrobium sp.]